MRKYKHHLYPRYMAKKGEIPPWGDPDLIVEVSFTQHIMFHWCNYQLWGNPEDKIAYAHMKGNGEEGKLAASKLANEAFLAKMESDPEFREKMKQASQKALSPEARAKRLETFRKNGHSQGSKNSQYGTMWITDGAKNRKIKRGDPIPGGFRAGRICQRPGNSP